MDDKHIIIASKYLTRSNSPSGAPIKASRKFVSRLGNLIIRLMFDINAKDTQCGFKLFPALLAEKIFRLQSIKGFAFDVEILTLANLYGYKTIEMPIELKDSDESRVRTVKDSMRVFRDLLLIKFKVWSRFYHKPYANDIPDYQLNRII
jgi:dolichyl-phosphate beta-glucosyltransferase